MQHKGLTVWFTGLSGAGKTTISQQQDVKGLYQKARAGAIKNFTSVNDPSKMHTIRPNY
jgi:adenylylsulfate kinase-like enzyme